MEGRAEALLLHGQASDAAAFAQVDGDVWLAARALLLAGQPLRAHAQLAPEDSEDARAFKARCLCDTGLGERALAELGEAPSDRADEPASTCTLRGRALEELGCKQQASIFHERALLLDNLQLDSLSAACSRKLISSYRLHSLLSNHLARALAGLGVEPSLIGTNARRCAPVRSAEASRFLNLGDPESALDEVRGLELEPGAGCAEALTALASLSRSHELLRITHNLSTSSTFAPSSVSSPPSGATTSASAAAAAAAAASATSCRQQQQHQHMSQMQAAATPVPASCTSTSAPIACLPAYAAGCQHFAARQLDAARRWFSRACSRAFPPAWLGFAHALAEQEEHDQALAAYRAAMRAFPEWHAPRMFLGTEHLAQSGAQAALHFLRQAKDRAPQDWQVHAELGAAYYAAGQQDEYAEYCTREALSRLPNGTMAMQYEEVLRANLGHVLRRQGKLSDAVGELQGATCTGDGRKAPGTHTAMGLCYIQLGMCTRAVEALHTSLSLKPNDSVASELLEAALSRTCRAEESRAEAVLRESKESPQRYSSQ